MDGNGTTEVVWATCDPCEEALPQMIHEADHIDEDELRGGTDASE